MKPRYDFAKKMAQKVSKDYNLDTLPVNIKTVFLERGIKYVEIDDLDGIDGAVMEIKGKGKVAVINNAKSLVRQRFTLAHELGHIFLKHSEIDLYDPEDVREMDIYSFEKAKPPKEVEADIFASELLIPTNKLIVLFEENRDIEFLSKKFFVSTQAIAVAINRNLNRLTK